MPLTSCGPRIGAERTGVLIRGLLPLSACAQQGLVLRGDVLLELDGQPIADDGTFAVGQQERLSFQHLIHLKFAGELVRLRLLREGTEVEVEVPVYPQARLVPSHIYDSPQQYFIYGGLAFVALTEPYLQASGQLRSHPRLHRPPPPPPPTPPTTAAAALLPHLHHLLHHTTTPPPPSHTRVLCCQEWGDEWVADAPHELVHIAMSGISQQQGEQPVILSRIFPSKLSAAARLEPQTGRGSAGAATHLYAPRPGTAPPATRP